MSDSNTNNSSVKKEKRGYIYPNERKLNERSPDYTGRFLLEGKEWKISFWDNIAGDGKPYKSLSISEIVPHEQGFGSHAVQPGGQPILRPKPINGAVIDLSNDDISDLDDILGLTDDSFN